MRMNMRMMRSASRPPNYSKLRAYFKPDGAGGVVDSIGLSSRVVSRQPQPISEPKKILRAVDFIPHDLQNADGFFAYGIRLGGKSTLVKYDVAGNYSEAFDFSTLDTDFEIGKILTTSVAGLVFAEIANTATGERNIFKSINFGESWGANSPLYDDGLPIKQLTFGSRLLGNNSVEELLVDSPSGFLAAGDLLIAEYQTNTPWTDIYLWYSKDMGDTWIAANFWDGDLSQIRHMHCVQQDPYTGYIFIGTGDGPTESGIIKWDGDPSTLTNNETNHFVTGYKAKPVSLLFNTDSVIVFSDNIASDDDTGIFNINKTTGEITKVDNQVDWSDGHDGGFALQSSSGTYYYTEILESSATSTQSVIYSSDDGVDWTAIGYYGIEEGNTSSVLLTIFEFNNNIYLSSIRPSGKLGRGTAVAAETAVDIFEQPEILHPVYWVSTDGNDSNDGYTPSTPWRTAAKALGGNNVTNGSRINFAAGVYIEGQCPTQWDNNTYRGNGRTEIHGSGRESTVIRFDATSTGSYFLYLTNSSPMSFHDMWVDNQVAGIDAAQILLGTDVSFVDCHLGNPVYDVKSVVKVFGSVTIKRSLIERSSGGSNAHIQQGDTSATVLCEYSIFTGGIKHIQCNNVAARNTVFYDFLDIGIENGAAATIPITAKNCIFICDPPARPIQDRASLTETDSHIDYNLYSVTSHILNVYGIANSGGTNSLFEADPLFTDPSSGDFTLQSTSPCITAGIASDSLDDHYDLSGEKVHDGMHNMPDGQSLYGVSIGAYQYAHSDPFAYHLTVISGTWPTDLIVAMPQAPKLIDLLGLDSAFYDASGVPKSIAWSAIGDDAYRFDGPKAALIYSEDKSADADKINRFCGN